MTLAIISVKSNCSKSNCSHLCLIVPDGYTCACPQGTIFVEDSDTLCNAGQFLLAGSNTLNKTCVVMMNCDGDCQGTEARWRDVMLKNGICWILTCQEDLICQIVASSWRSVLDDYDDDDDDGNL